MTAAIAAGFVAAGAGAGSMIGHVNEEDPNYKGLAALGGALTGAALTGIGGLVVAATSKKYRKPALATAALGIGGIALLVAGNAVYKGLAAAPAPAPQVGPPGPAPTPGPGSNIGWTQIPLGTALSPSIVYRLSDAATAAEMQSASLGSVQSSLGSAFQVDGVWTGSPPPGWVPADTGTGRVYVEFWVSAATTLPSTGFTSAARLYRQQANV
jgi:hypothetical protein